METNLNFRTRSNVLFISLAGLIFLSVLSACDDDDPQKENTPELITKTTLTFTPSDGGATVTAMANDPDGEGVQDIEVAGPINLEPDKSYTLTIQLINELADPTDPEYNITEEVEEEGAEHMFFFSWTNDLFTDPAGDGNIDNRADAVNYKDEDESGQPIGLETSWTTAGLASGTFHLVLKHQPDLKTGTSTAATGETDLDLEFDINIQ